MPLTRLAVLKAFGSYASCVSPSAVTTGHTGDPETEEMAGHPMQLDEPEVKNHVSSTCTPFLIFLTDPSSITFAFCVKMVVSCGHATTVNVLFAQGVSLFLKPIYSLCVHLMSNLSASAATGSSPGAARLSHHIG